MKWALLSVGAVLMLVDPAQAQPPGIDSRRWSGTTALSQPQGFGQGAPLRLTWGFMALGTPINDQSSGGYPAAPNDLQTRLNAIYGNQATWQPHFQSVFDRWSALSGLSYQFEPNDDGAAIVSSTNTFPRGILNTRPDLRIGGKPLNGNGGVLAYNYFPNVSDMVIDTNDTFYNNTSGNSLRLRNVVAHEHGHGMGQAHVESTSGAFLMEPFIDLSFDGPQHHDILAAQRAYGDVLEKSNNGLGNDTVARATPLGTINLGGSVSLGNSARTLVVAATATDFVSIDDNNDTDFFSFTATDRRVNILLEALGFGYTVTSQGNGGNVAFTSLTRSNLILTLFDTNGTTILRTVNASGLGGSEFIGFDLAATGTYFIRVTGTDNVDTISMDTQFYGLTVGVLSVPEPTTWALLGLACGSAGMILRRRLKYVDVVLEDAE